jgi:predicted SpoU family rRNA methylase
LYIHIHLKKEADIEYPFKHGEVVNYTLYGVSIHPVTNLVERKETTTLE